MGPWLPWRRAAWLSVLLIQFSPSGVGMEFQFSYAALMLSVSPCCCPFWCIGRRAHIRPAMDRAGGSEGALAVDAMIQSPRRSAATVGALMVGLMFVYSTAAYIQSYKHMVNRWTNQMLNADLDVATSTLLRSTSYHFSEDLGRRIGMLPEVKRVQNVRFTIVPYRGDTVAVSAIEMDGFLSRSFNAILGGNKKTLYDLLPQRQRRIGLKKFCRALEIQGWRSSSSGYSDRPSGIAHRGHGRGLPVGQGYDLHGSCALQAILERRWRGLYRYHLEAGPKRGRSQERD